MKLIVPGFPSEVSAPIELPDIGELLFAPFFQGIGPEEFLKHSTDFQASLFNQIPIRNDRRFITIRSGVWLLEPGSRSHVNFFGNWHIDGLSSSGMHERYFILSSQCTALTEFNTTSMEEELFPLETHNDLLARLARDGRLIPKRIDPCRIYTFEDHVHRAVDPCRIEFRFFFRVQESDDAEPRTKAPLNKVKIRSCVTGIDRVNVEHDNGRVLISRPEHYITTPWL
jgi:hypothetical protein